MAQRQEAGYVGKLRSLGGMEGAQWHGRVQNTFALTVTSGNILIPANGRRIAAIITAPLENTEVVYIGFGELYPGSTPGYGVYLNPGQSFQIDANFPWTGTVIAESPSGTAPVVAVEIGLE